MADATQTDRITRERVEVLWGIRGDRKLSALRVGEATDLWIGVQKGPR